MALARIAESASAALGKLNCCAAALGEVKRQAVEKMTLFAVCRLTAGRTSMANVMAHC
jgi:hypothetical protein